MLALLDQCIKQCAQQRLCALQDFTASGRMHFCTYLLAVMLVLLDQCMGVLAAFVLDVVTLMRVLFNQCMKLLKLQY